MNKRQTVMNGPGDEVIDLARSNLWAEEDGNGDHSGPLLAPSATFIGWSDVSDDRPIGNRKHAVIRGPA
jgi:hypothetical protein